MRQPIANQKVSNQMSKKRAATTATIGRISMNTILNLESRPAPKNNN